MSEPNWAKVCESEIAATLAGKDFCADVAHGGGNPIDDYYAYVEHILTLGDEESLQASDTLGRLLLLGLVSGVEVYLRSVLAGILRICPVSRSCAADQLISFGAVDYYGMDGIEWSLFDSTSLASASEIRSRTRKLVGLEVPPGSSLDGALTEYDKVCNLRHAAVHARGTLGRGNASALGLVRDDGALALRLSLTTLHQAGATCHSLVRAYDRFLYRKTVERWLEQGRFRGTWDEDGAIFRSVFELFHSRRDAQRPTTAYQAYRSLAPSIGR